MEKLWSALVLALMLLAAGAASAGPAADAGTAVDRWAAAFNANDVDALVGVYAADATLMGTAGATVKQGREAIRRYYARLNRSGDEVSLGERKIIALSNDIAYVTGDYEFSALRSGERQMAPARFTMVLVRRGRDWLIAHHHSSRQLETLPRMRRAGPSARDYAWSDAPAAFARPASVSSREPAPLK
jgi:uncharacterized protein (TIGR02246 family)